MKKLVSIATVVVSLFSLAACTAENVEPSGSSASKIIGGSSDPGHPSVGLLRSVIQVGFDGTPALVGGCTATLIGPTAMVTAAHCATDPRLWNEVSFDVAPDQFAVHGAPGWISAGLIVHPQYDGDTSHGHDVAVVVLTERPERPLVPLAAPPPVGTVVTAVGYGMNVFGSGGAGSGQRRTVDISILGIAEHELVAGRDGQGTCHGDSGGPLLAGGALVGTTSYGDSVDCHSSAHFMRVDDNIDFLRRFVPSL
ncbi:MAG: hypothetical protein QOI41_5122 [Myxococcales bacterium]|jgi:secreted trypsin-like serine protease|nr:hypothetical protein [Myxococcales bacterium]